MNSFRRFSGSTWGASLHHMRRLYLTKVRPKITYACTAWFISAQHDRMRWEISRTLLDQLESLQYQCVVQISGALQKTSYEVLLKELYVEKITTVLQRLAVVERAQNLHSELEQLIAKQRPRSTKGTPKSSLAKHPYCWLKDDTTQFEQVCQNRLRALHNPDKFNAIWHNPKEKTLALKEYVKVMGEATSELAWDSYRQRRDKNKRQPPALRENWGPQSLALYAGLPRAHSTMLVHCRTGRIGLNAYLFTLNSKKSTVSCTFPRRSEQAIPYRVTRFLRRICVLALRVSIPSNTSSLTARI